MKKPLTILFLMLCGNILLAQNLEVQTFGHANDKPIIFLHGGPGYNSVSFEKTTAEALAKNGFFVISYDRRGEGRNEPLTAAYTFNETFDDINQIFKSFNLKKVSLIGHSFGGVIATLFADNYPDKINSLILVGTPVSMQETLKNIVSKSKAIYLEKDDKVSLNYINMLEKMDSTSLEYSSYSFMHAMSNGFYATKSPNQDAIALYKTFQSDTLLKKYASKMGYVAPQKFWKNEQYTTISLRENLENLKAKKVKVFAIYGKEDGLYSEEQIENLKSILGDSKVIYLDNCSHSVFIDQQKEFIESIKKWTK
ncbi:alpha/beta hydrolase [Flavobacteriaceae bacterium LYZ1037]|nr:alpha/beta hydrolase [Flavobacteriaceae bacterium LYZ1037]